MEYTLTVTERVSSGSKASSALRVQGQVPGIVYGAALEKPVAVQFQDAAFLKVWQGAGETTIVSLDGLAKKQSVLIHDVAVDPVYGTPVHVDFYAVRTDQAVEVSVPLVFTGVAPAEKELGGTLIKVQHALTVEALPKDLPHEISVDISGLVTFTDQLLVKDIALPTGVRAVTEPTEVVALVQEARAEEEAAPAADVASVEVEKKGKEEQPAA